MASSNVITDGASTVATQDELLSRSRDVNWYNKNLAEVPEKIRVVFEEYSKIPADQINEHVYGLRERAWEIFPFPCLGGWRFLDLILCNMPQYPEIVSRVQKGDRFLDLGCCFGQELRRLIYDGAPSENLYGTDIQSQFLDLGYDLFLDREKCKATLFAADAFAESSKLTELSGTFSIVYAGAFFHLFDRPEQVTLAKLVTRLLKREAGSILLGRQVGSVKPGAYQHATNGGGTMFRHDVQSWRELWEEVGKEMGVKWEVEGRLIDSGSAGRWRDQRIGDANVREFLFCVRRG